MRGDASDTHAGALLRQFVVPPFSVLDTRAGYQNVLVFAKGDPKPKQWGIDLALVPPDPQRGMFDDVA